MPLREWEILCKCSGGEGEREGEGEGKRGRERGRERDVMHCTMLTKCPPGLG